MFLGSRRSDRAVQGPAVLDLAVEPLPPWLRRFALRLLHLWIGLFSDSKWCVWGWTVCPDWAVLWGLLKLASGYSAAKIVRVVAFGVAVFSA